MEIYGYIYLITNLVNNKKYVGQTIKTIIKRFNQHHINAKNGFSLEMPITKAIKKHGKENFIVQELAIEIGGFIDGLTKIIKIKLKHLKL